jgi:nicotinamidase-related amidase
MPITTLDPKTALVVIDLQRGITNFPTAHPHATIIARAADLARAFRKRSLPVVLVNVAGVPPGRTDGGVVNFQPPPGWTDIVPELEMQPSDIAVTKLNWGAFHGTSLELHLRRRGVTQIVLAGISTSIGVESTARTAYELGYNVTLAVDAMTDMKMEAHENSVATIFPRLGETGTTEAILGLLG